MKRGLLLHCPQILLTIHHPIFIPHALFDLLEQSLVERLTPKDSRRADENQLMPRTRHRDVKTALIAQEIMNLFVRRRQRQDHDIALGALEPVDRVDHAPDGVFFPWELGLQLSADERDLGPENSVNASKMDKLLGYAMNTIQCLPTGVLTKPCQARDAFFPLQSVKSHIPQHIKCPVKPGGRISTSIIFDPFENAIFTVEVKCIYLPTAPLFWPCEDVLADYVIACRPVLRAPCSLSPALDFLPSPLKQLGSPESVNARVTLVSASWCRWLQQPAQNAVKGTSNEQYRQT
jgi:hypothetical protein